jgi:hypothetical protein
MTASHLCLATALFACSASAHAGKDESKPIPLNPNMLTLSVDAAGAISGLACKSEIPEPTCRILTKTVSNWKFAPGLREGAPVAMDIELILSMVAIPKEGGYGLRAVDASIQEARTPGTQSPVSRGMGPPAYPAEELRRGLGGTVVLELWVEPGSDTVRVGKRWFNRQPAGNGNRFAAAAANAARSWKIDGADGRQKSYCVAATFMPNDGKPPGTLDTSPCKPTYVEGYAPPTLLTPVDTAVF